MYIHEVIIDGFKSYAQKTVVSGFDPQFNAITGLNGSGKSNILDSICFVLGISNLTQVRVGNLQELVYKQGQAGVTKASVTIVFNNEDPSTSPVGYESNKQITVTRQVVLGGKNKYMINGHTVQQSQVQNLFHSVQLNVNNPHFLIMQGRITKVLNMKPQEILSMIEEAAGTRMFETKKQAAIKTIEKKQLKVEEITKCMSDEITPTLEGLRGERQNYLSWQSNNTELERVERFCIAAEYKDAEDKVRSSEDDKKKLADECQAYEDTQTEKTREADECTRRIGELEALRENDLESGLADLKKKESELSKDLVKSKATYTNHQETLQNEKEALLSLNKALESVKTSLVEKQSECDVFGVTLKHKETEANESEALANSLREKYQNACAGVADDAGTAALLSIPEQIATWEKKAREANSQLQQGTLKANHCKDSLKELRKTLKSQQSIYDSAIKECDTIQAAVTKLESQMAGANMQFDEAAETSLKTRSETLRAELTHLRDAVDTLTANVHARLNFEYKDPEKGFDRSRVKGLVASLIRVQPTEKRACTALEIAAGAKLFQVIVDTEQTGKLLLQKGQLKKRVTILPLNKVSYRLIEPAKLDRARAIAQSMRGTARLALDLVTFDESVRKAMEYTFGNVIVCDSSDIAKAIAYDKSISCRTVTLEGDSFDPSGTVTGGSTSQIGVLLAKIEELEATKDRLASVKAELQDATQRLQAMEAKSNAARDLLAQLDVKRHALVLCREKLATSSYGQLNSEIQALENQLKMHEQEQEMLKETFKRANDELKKVKDAENSIKKDREKAMKEMEGQVKSAAKTANAVKAEVAKLKSQRDAISAELTGLSNEITALKEQITVSEASIVKMSKEADVLNGKLEHAKRAYEDAQVTLQNKQQELNQCSKEIKALIANRDKFQKAAQNASLEARKVQHKLKQWEKDFKDASKNMTALLKQHPWIEKERAYFGVAGSDFDFAAKDVTQASKRLKDLKADQEKLSKKINKKVMGMIEKAETEYDDLRRKKEVILNDKAKIEAVIEELDVKKSQALQTTWIKVNRDFGSIFSMLLPGTHAKLEPPEGCTVSDGLEVKVAFNGVWKESLTELSGGQRSLLALSLILSLLLFKPAPMYILDEVDAALDLSHTQNIGLMLRTHFSSSQFIVVSLKEGMFNNANVIFRTKFIDGVSTVSRTVLNSSRPGGAGAKQPTPKQIEDIDDIRSPQKKKGKSGAKKAAGRENAIEA